MLWYTTTGKGGIHDVTTIIDKEMIYFGVMNFK